MSHSDPAATVRRSNQTAVLAIILVSYLMIVLDISIVITALPRIHETMDISAIQLSWVQSAYTLAFGSFLLLGARAGDILGRRRMFIFGIGLFALASLAVGLAQNAALLVGGRVLQGVGAAILAPSTLALLSTNFAEGRERNRAVSYYAAVAGVGASLGLVVGGVLTSLLTWRVGFFINVPVAVAMIILTPRYIDETERRSGDLDLLGAVTSTLGMSALVYGIVQSASDGWRDVVAVTSMAGGVALLVLFVAVESRVHQPIMPLRLFRSWERSGAYAARVLFLGGMLGFWFFTTQLLQDVRGYSALEAGLAFLPTTIPNFAAAILAPRLARRLGNGGVLVLGLLCGVVGLAWLGQASADTPFVTSIALPMVLVGIGQGGVLGPLTSAGIAGVSAQDAGAASGVVNVAHQIGGSLGLSILVAVFAASAGGLSGSSALVHGIGVALTGGAVMLALALAVVVVTIVRPGTRSAVGAHTPNRRHNQELPVSRAPA